MLAVLGGLLGLACLLPAGSSAATLAQVRSQLRSWQLRPAPLFPASLPAGLRGTDVSLDRWDDYDVGFDKSDATGLVFAMQLKRGPWGVFNQLLHDPVAYNVRRMRIGRRTVSVAETGHSGAAELLTWHEQGRTYWVTYHCCTSNPLRLMAQLVQSLRTL